MRYIGGVATVVALVFPLVILYKLWNTRRDSNININGTHINQQSSSSSDVTSYDSTNSLSLPSVEYEVFLSFRGPDTRNQITEILYRFLIHSKIHTFKDDDEMRKGEGIWPALVKAINQSKVYVPILSENYTHSKWCLNELAEIVECRKKDNRRIILPIFYMVDPRDVRHQSGPYQKAFQQHEKMFDPSTIQSWKNALKEIGTLKGWHVKNNDEQIAISDSVCEDVCSHVIKSNDLLDNTVELVGIDDHVNAVINSLSLDSNEGMVMVGIHGIGGIGKTTLATSVYNKISTCFERCSFLENIRETQQQKDGILTLQKKLISDVMRKDFGGLNDAHEGRKIIRERVSQFKVLVVLDDVDNTFKFDDILGSAINFTHESRFIATSRDIKVLRSLNEEQCRLYEVNYMDHDRSLQLFCKHAFRKDSPPREFDTLSRDIVSTAGGLPLTVKVVGSLLYREEVNIWEEKLAQLKETTEKEVIERLKISYNSLEHEAKQIFLDIACFFIGSEKEIVSYMWADCNFRPLSNINILIQRSMIKINESNEFHMHDQLRDMGRDVVRCENIDFPWMRSRLWSEDDIMEMLRDKKGTNQVKGILLNNSTSSVYHIKSESFMNMSEIRYLETSNYVQLEGDFSNLLPNLRWLSLSNYGKEEDFNDHLLNLREPFTNLCMKNLVIFYSWGEELNIGKLRNLQVLDMQSSEIRKITGGTIGMLTRLRELNVEDCECQNLEQVLVDVEKLKCLKILRTTGHTKSKCLQELVILTLSNLRSTKVMNGLSKLSKLKYLSIEESPCLREIEGLSECKILEKICLVDCPSLEKLQVSGLENLEVLRIERGSKVLERCEGEELNIGKLRNLQVLESPCLREIEGLSECKNLKRICLKDCPSLEKFQVSGLEKLEFLRIERGNKVLERLPSMSNLPRLQELALTGFTNLREIGNIADLKCLKMLNLEGCEALERLPVDQLSGLEELWLLDIIGCTKLKIDRIDDINDIETILPNIRIIRYH
ncbi:Disease resistance protein L6 [Linum perenne]